MCGNIPRVFISAQYHVIFDGMFTTVVVSSDKGVPKDTSKDKNDNQDHEAAVKRVADLKKAREEQVASSAAQND